MPTKLRNLTRFDKWRVAGAPVGDPRFEGVFEVTSPLLGTLIVIAAADLGWDHVSVSGDRRTPTWSEMEFVKRMFFESDAVCFQLHVGVAEHISIHPHVLHIWRSWDHDPPMPPKMMV